MNSLRIVLIGLAVVVFAALGWRLAITSPPRRVVVAAAPTITKPPAMSPPTAVAPPVPMNASPSASQPEPPAVSLPASPAREVASPPAPIPVGPSPAARARVEAVLRGAPDLARVFDHLKADFPAVATQVAANEAARIEGTDAQPSADEILADAVRDLQQSSGVLASRASPESLGAVFDAQSAILTELAQTDTRLCADYLFGGTSPEFTDFEAGHRSLFARSAEARIKATAEGRALQITKAAPSGDDFKGLEDGLLAKGLSSDEVSALLDGKSIDPPLPDERLCANARAYLDVLRTLPVEPRTRIYGLAAELLARS